VVPVLQAQSGSLQVQIPWKASGFADTITFQTPNDSSFDSTRPIDVTLDASRFFGAPSGQSGVLGLDFIKSDWSAVLTAPPGPEDIVYAYLTGLGPVRAAAEVRREPLRRTGAGTSGIYQVAFRMPADAGAPITDLSCTPSTPWGSTVFGTVGQ
jgi:uncharacterized protein (TIGR03437 family)